MNKQNIIDQCREAKACEKQFTLLTSAATEKEFIEVLARNIFWCNAKIQLPADVLELLSKDEDPYVREGVAFNPNVPIAILELLSKDENSYVRRGVALNPNFRS